MKPETTERLWWHAGLSPTARREPAVPSVDELLLEADHTPEQFDAAMADLLETFQALNVALNGSPPSASVIADKDENVSRDVAWAVCAITRHLREQNKLEAAWTVDTAWEAVLGGDIDDIGVHVEQERWARSGPASP